MATTKKAAPKKAAATKAPAKKAPAKKAPAKKKYQRSSDAAGPGRFGLVPPMRMTR